MAYITVGEFYILFNLGKKMGQMLAISKDKKEEKPLPYRKSSEVIIGYRWWRVQMIAGQYRLVSVVHPIIWLPGQKMTDENALNGYASVQVDNTSGIYAYNCNLDYGFTRTTINNHIYDMSTFLRVKGEVSLWGRVICTERGYRAQYGYPRRLFMSKNLTYLAAYLRRIYGIEVEVTGPPG